MSNTPSQKPFGIVIATSLVIGNMIGSGVYLLPASLAAFGTISIYSWIFTTIGAMLLALVFSDLNRRLPRTGGAFLYARHVYGDFVGFAIAASYWFAWCVGNAGMAVAIVGYVTPFWPALNDQSLSYSPFIALAIKLGAIWSMTLVNILGLKHVGRLQVLTTIIKLLPLLLIIIVGIFKIKISNLTGNFNISGQSNLSAFTGAATLTLWAFIGLESAVVPADEVTNHRVITKATMIGTFSTAMLYILLTISLLGLIPAGILKNSTSPLADAAITLFGNHADLWIAGFAIITIMGALNGSILVQVQDAMAAADHKLFPALFSKRSRFNTPARGFIISALIMSVLLLLTLHDSLLKQFNFLLLLSTLSFLIPYFISATAELMILLSDKEGENWKKRFAKNVIAIAASIYAFWMFIGAGKEIIVYGCLFFFSLFWVYWLFKISKTRTQSI